MPSSPAFEVRCLGVLGGDLDENLSCFLVSRAAKPEDSVMIDGGSVTQGIIRWKVKEGQLAADASWSARTQTVTDVLQHVSAFLVTHAHLDHIAGFVVKSTLDLSLAQKGRPTLAM